MNGEQIHLFMIHKIEIFPHYTYPIVPHITNSVGQNNEQTTNNNTNAMLQREGVLIKEKSKLDLTDSENVLPPYRTLSHYGFNYPSTYMPNILLHPACSLTPVSLQRQKVIAFIKRLNEEVHSNKHFYPNKTETVKEDGNSKSGKEEKIYENTENHIDSTDVVAINTAESFISIAEIQLNAVRETITSQPKLLQKQQEDQIGNCKKRQQSNHVALQSHQFSSLLSVSGTYPVDTHSHFEDAENDHITTTDSGDNFSTFELQSSQKTTNDNLYRSYLRKNYLPEITDSHHSIMDFRDRDDELDPHKPESEQQSQNKTKQSSKLIRNHGSKHITLTLNSLKRRASSMCEKKATSKALSCQAVPRTQFSDANSSCDSSTASTAIEIHININVRNRDCVKNLQNHEQEFKSKLEKVIGDEINLITQELALPSQCESESKNITSFNLTPQNRCLSAPEAICLSRRVPTYTDAGHQSFNINEPGLPAVLDQAPTIPLNLQAMRYRQTLNLLEQELEILLNSIIRDMCNCKTKITQISEDIRTATLYVGSLKTTPAKTHLEKNLIEKQH